MKSVEKGSKKVPKRLKRSKTDVKVRKRPKSVKIGIRRSKTAEIGQNQSKTAEIDGNLSKTVEIGRKRTKSVENGQNGSKMVENRRNRSNSIEIGRKRTKTVEIGQKRPKSVENGGGCGLPKAVVVEVTSWKIMLEKKIVLSVEDKLPFLEQPIPDMPVPPVGQVLPPDVLNTHTAWVKDSKEIAGLMLMTMDLDIQKNLEYLGAYDMLKELKMLYAQQADQELFQTVREFHACKQEEERNMMVLCNMHSMGKTVTELHAMLKLHEQTLPPREAAPALHAIRAGRVQKKQKKKSHKAAKGNQGKGKTKIGNALVPAPSFAPKPKNPPTPKKDN
nr:zinc finger, CCHC-type [Tanacetum cinerariifolium]